MTNHIVEGRRMPDWVAGHPALEFCNTKALWDLPIENEYFTDHTATVIWAREHELITASEARGLRAVPPARQRSTLGQLRALRRCVYYAMIDPLVPLDPIHAYVVRAVERSSYRQVGPVQKLQAPFSPTVVLDRVALEVNHLLETYGREAVGLCNSEACGWVFLDPSHRRRWCTMAICGNRAKARRFAERRRA